MPGFCGSQGPLSQSQRITSGEKRPHIEDDLISEEHISLTPQIPMKGVSHLLPAWGIFERALGIHCSVPHLCGVSCPQKWPRATFIPSVVLPASGFPGWEKKHSSFLVSVRFVSLRLPTFCPFRRQPVILPFLPLHSVALSSHPVTGFMSDVFQASGWFKAVKISSCHTWGLHPRGEGTALLMATAPGRIT